MNKMAAAAEETDQKREFQKRIAAAMKLDTFTSPPPPPYHPAFKVKVVFQVLTPQHHISSCYPLERVCVCGG